MVVLTSSAAIADLGSRRRSAVQWALLSVASGFLLFLAIHPRLLFFGDQNTYLLHGLARAGYGSLASDWLASTKSPLPLFDVLVELTWLAFGNNGFYLLQAILYLVLAAGLLLLLSCSRLELKSGVAGPLLVFTTLAALWGWAPSLSPIWAQLRDGFAVQTILSDKLEPSSFGIFLLMSVALFAAGRVTFACVLAAVTCLFHPTYLIASAVLVLVYATHTAVVEHRPLAAAKDLVIYTVLLSPIVLFLLLQFSPSNPETYRKAAEILVYERIPYHALPQVWISRHGFITIAMIISGALVWVGPNRRVAYVIAISGCAILVLTLLTVAVNWAPFYLLFPWRLSTVLVPVAALGIVSRGVGFIQRYCSRRGYVRVFGIGCLTFYAALLGGSAAIVAQGGIKSTPEDSPEYADPNYQALVGAVASDPNPAAVYLFPPRLMESFRLRTGHPIVADFKSHPFKDVEILDWEARLQWADRFFAGGACGTTQAPYEFDRVVAPRSPSLSVQNGLVEQCLLNTGHWYVTSRVPGYDVLAERRGGRS